MENYIAKCPVCGREMQQVKVVCNGAVILTMICRCTYCDKEYVAEFDKFYQIDCPELLPLDPAGMDEDGFDRDGFDRDGFNPKGFDRNHIHRETGTLYDTGGLDWESYDSEGLDRRGFDRNGFYMKTQSRYNPDGYDCCGYDKDGYNEDGLDKFGKGRDNTPEDDQDVVPKSPYLTYIILLIILGAALCLFL